MTAKGIDTAFLLVASVLQLGIAVALLWVANTDSLNLVLASTVDASQSTPEMARLILEYRQALAIARAIFSDVGIGLLCSVGLTAIVLYRQSARRTAED